MTAIEWLIKELPHLKADLLKGIIEQAKEIESIEKHAEYMRGWKDGYIKNDPK